MRGSLASAERVVATVPPRAEPSQVVGIILAGGRSRRMGRDKAFLPWGRATLLERVMSTLRPLVDELIVVVNDARRFRDLDARVVEDAIPAAHALGGIYTGLVSASHDRCFVCACDMPFLNPRLIRFLARQGEGWDLVIPRTARGLEPLHAVYAASIVPAMATQLRRRQWDLRALAERVRATIIGPEAVARHDPEGLSCLNLNTPADYALARRMRLTDAAGAIDKRTGACKNASSASRVRSSLQMTT